ncbi:MAG: hypothetical protein AAB373_00465 [Patescibacteria group bacterium]
MYKKEWIGESGYCNCLLVSMARAKITKVEVATNEFLPKLEKLVAKVPETLKWIKAQKLNYDKLNQLLVIDTFLESAKMSRHIWSKRTGNINAYDLVGDTDLQIKRVYAFKLSRSWRTRKLEITLEEGKTF